jgi:large subunit ribosomal protein L4
MSTRKQPQPAKGAKRLSWKANLLFAAVILTAAALLVFLLRPRSKAEPLAAVVDFGVSEAPSTKAAVAALTPVTENKFTTVVLSRENVNEWLSVRNIPTVHPIFADQLNTYDVVTAQYVVFSKEGFDAFLAAKAEPAAKEA